MAVTALIALLATGCGSTVARPAPTSDPSGPRTTYVAVGGSDAIGSGTDDPLLDAWPQQFFRHSLPLTAVFVNAAEPGATVAEAITDQAPLATSSRATVVTVWLVSTDLLDGTPASTYGNELLRLLTTLRGHGATTVLVGNVPPLAQLPGYPACRSGAARLGRGQPCPATLPAPAVLAASSVAYNQAIAADAARSGAILVDLQRGVATAVTDGGPPILDPTGADLSTAGSTLVAQAFSGALPARSGHTA
jgi:hypothetical protein